MPSNWTWLRSHLVVDDLLIHSEVGPGGLSRGEAHTYIDRQLTATAGTDLLRRAWARGAKDDTIYAKTTDGMMVWAILAHGEQSPVDAALVWLEDFAAIQRRLGIDAQVARPRTAPENTNDPTQ